MKTIRCLLGLTLVSLIACVPSGHASAAEEVSALPAPEVLRERALVSMGDTARVQRVLAKARRSEKVVVAVIGGSITAGACASTEEKRWGNQVAAWWRARFPKASIDFVNAGIGATGSDIGAHRVAVDLLAHRPDFVAVEFAVNDGGSPMAGESLEGLLRQLLKQPQAPAVVLLFTMNNQGRNTQEAHEPVGRHYGLPMLSFRDALWPEVEAGHIAWIDIEADTVHPNDRGHGYCADFVNTVLERACEYLPTDDALPPCSPLPKPLISDVFEYAAMFSSKTLTPSRCEGWVPVDTPYIGPGWKAEESGSVIEFELEGTAISVLPHAAKEDMGTAQVQVDALPPVTIDAYFAADWGGGYTPFKCIARGLPPGTHRLRITLLDQKNPESNGHLFRLCAVLAAGRAH